MDVFVHPGGSGGPSNSYLITPQPLPANMTFNRQTGELVFAPAPDQSGQYQFSVSTTAGSEKVTQPVTITVAKPPESSTKVSGQVVDETGKPLSAVPVTIGDLKTVTDSSGHFSLSNVPENPPALAIDGYLASPGGDRATVMDPLEAFLGHSVYRDANNQIPQPIVDPKVDTAHATDFSKVNQNQAVDVANPTIPGVVLHVAPNSAVTADGKPFTGLLGLTALPAAPGAPSLSTGPDLMVSGPDLMFTTPATVTLPNSTNLAPGTVINLQTMNMTNGAFEVTGHLQVSPDGRTLNTIDGGVPASSCILADAQRALGLAKQILNGICQTSAQGNSAIGVVTGDLTESHSLVTYQSQGENHGINLQYSSGQADPQPIVGFQPTTQDASNSSQITTITAQVTVGGVIQGNPVTYTPSGLGDNTSLQIPLQIDATALPNGVYPYTLAVTSNFQDGHSYSTTYQGNVSIHNASSSALGAGWSVAGLEQLNPPTSPNGPLSISQGSGGDEAFNYQAGNPINDIALLAADGSPAGQSNHLLINDGMGGFSTPSSGSWVPSTATWQFSGLAPGTYLVQADWTGNASGNNGHATNAPFQILDGTTPLQTVTVDQSVESSGTAYGGMPFQTLATVSIASGTLKVVLTDGANGAVVADAVAVTPVDPITGAPTGSATIIDNGGAGYSTTGPGWTSWSTPWWVSPSTTYGSDSQFVNIGGTAQPQAYATGDFNGDGIPDIAEITPNAVSILLSNGSGGFTPGATYNLSLSAVAIVAANFTGHTDGKLDLAVLGHNGQIAVLPGNGNGTFGTPIITQAPVYNEASGSYSLAAGDFNGDGKTDLAIANGFASEVDIVDGNGAGGFQLAQQVTLQRGHYDGVLLLAGDFTGDGKIDIAAAENLNHTLSYLTNNGQGNFTITGTYMLDNSSGIQGMAAGDFYGNGQIDLALLGYGAFIPVFPVVQGGSWGAPVIYNEPGHSKYANGKIIAADVNGDGKPDLIVADGSNLFLLETDPQSNQFQPMQTVNVTTPINGKNQLTSGDDVLAVAPFTGRTRTAQYVGSMGDSSTITHNVDGTWDQHFLSGTTIHFNSAGQEVSETDRNRNTTSYSYVTSGPATGALLSVTDSVGLQTVFGYDTSGHLSTITDPANRVTQFAVDGNGNLTQITDPDGAVTKYGYATPSNHEITSETNPNRYTATVHYDSFGKVTSETLFDGTSSLGVAAAQEQGLLAPGGSGSLPLASGYLGTVTDPNGHTTTTTFDSMGDPTSTADAAGNTTKTISDMNGRPIQVTDSASRVSTYTWDDMGNLTQLTRNDQTKLSVVYDPTYDLPSQITDYNGLITTFTRDAHGNVLRRTDPDGLHEDYTYNSAGQVLTDTDRNGNTTTYTYDNLDRLTAVTLPGPGNPTVHYGYDAAGDITSVTDALNNTTTFTYDPAGRVLTSQDPLQAAAGKDVAYSYDANGNLISVTDALGHTTTYSYDARDRRMGSTDPANQGTGLGTHYSYDNAGNLTSVTDPLGHTTTFGYDVANNLTSVLDADGNLTRYFYNGDGQLTAVYNPNTSWTYYSYDQVGRLQMVKLSGTAPNGSGTQVPVETTYNYDGDGNLLTVTDALGHVATNTYDKLNRLISTTVSPDGTSLDTTSYAYDANGNQTSVTDALGHTTSYVYDARNELVSETQPGGGGTTTYSYDLDGRLQSVTDPASNTTSYGYDAVGQVTTITDPLDHVTTNVYDLAGNLTQTTDRDGRTIQYGYDADNRLTTETWVNPNGGAPLDVFNTTYDVAGRMTTIGDANSAYQYGYDNANRLTSVDDQGTPNLPHVTLSYSYDGEGNLTRVADSLGGQTTYAYDVRDELISESQSGTGVAPKRVDFAYNADGLRISSTRYSDLAGQNEVIGTSYTYDQANRLTGIANQTSGGTTISSDTYSLDAANRLIQETKTWTNSGGGSATDTLGYTYTANDQLAGVTHSNSSFTNETFSYDANGNRNSAGDSTHPGNQLASDGTYTYQYDNEGNLISKTSIASGDQTLYTWDFRNRLTEVDQVVNGVKTVVGTYTYDALNRLIGVSEGGAARWTLYNGGNPVLDFDGSGSETARYLSGPAVDEILARETPTGGVAWYLTDRQGSVDDLVNNSGAVIDHVAYSAFGQILSESNPQAGDRFKFTGQPYDAATGLYQFPTRTYDPSTGRWLNQDTVGFAGGDANLYRYVSNDPVDAVDPEGTFAILAVPGALAGAEGFALGATSGFAFGYAGGGGWAGGLRGFAVGGTFGLVTGFLIGTGIPPAAAGAAGGFASELVALAIDGKSPLSPDGASRLCTSTLVGAATVWGLDKAGQALNSPTGRAIGQRIGNFLQDEGGSVALRPGGAGGGAGGPAAGGAGGGLGGGAPANPANPVATNWRQHELIVTQSLEVANPGRSIGSQVTLDVTNNATGEAVRIRIDNLVPQGTSANPTYQLVDAKFSSVTDLTNPNANLANTVTDNQAQVYQWIASGQPVTAVPAGQNAINAGLTPGVPISVNPSVEIHVNGPNGIVVRQY